jgi:predicted ATPase
MIKRIKLNNFRSYRELDIPLGNLNVLVGRNGSGKSNLMSFFDLLGYAADLELNTFMRRRIGAFEDLRHYHAEDRDTVSWEVEFASPQHESLYYSVELGARVPAGYVIVSEKLACPPKAGESSRYPFLEAQNGLVNTLRIYDLGAENDSAATFENPTQELILPQLRNETRYPAQVEAYRYMRDLHVFQGFGDRELENIRSAQLLDVVDPLRLAADGSNLISVLNALIQDARYDAALSSLYEVMRTVFPDFKQFDLPSAGGGRATLAYRGQNLRKSVSAHLMSDGQLRFLGLLMLLMLPDPPRLIAIDEPEIGMHPRMLDVFAEIVKEASQRTQIILSTHSPQLLDRLPAESLLVVEQHAGVSTIKPLDFEAIQLWLEDYAPGYLWTNTTLIED